MNSVGVKKDEFETFWHILVTYCQQDAGYLDFFQGGQYDEWEALSSNPTRGITIQADVANMIIDQAQAVREANARSVQVRASLNSLLTTIAAYCPDGMFKTILTDSTSIAWIRNRLAQVCNIETSGIEVKNPQQLSWKESSHLSWTPSCLQGRGITEQHC